MILKIYNIHWE